jgi:hypothetical protein
LLNLTHVSRVAAFDASLTPLSCRAIVSLLAVVPDSVPDSVPNGNTVQNNLSDNGILCRDLL